MKKNKKEKTNYDEYKNIFTEYFNVYYQKNNAVKSLTYRDMIEEYKGENIGFSAVLEYKNFIQYVNVYWDMYEPFTINSCFTFDCMDEKLLCHFVDILNSIDSDDLSFYSYTHCIGEESVRAALDNIMTATEKYQTAVNNAALSDGALLPEITDVLREDDYDEADMISVPEDAYDFDFVTYELSFERPALKKYLARRARKNKLENKFEVRANRVLSAENRSDTKNKEKKRQNAHNFSKKDRYLASVMSIISMLVFGAIFGFIGYKLDSSMFADWIGKNHYDTGWIFALIGIFVGLLLLAMLPYRVFKPFMSEKRYEGFKAYLDSQNISTPAKVFVVTIIIVFALAGLYFFSFNGVGLTDNMEIKYKEYALSATEIYSLEDTEIAIVRGYNNRGFCEYGDTAYAFKVDGEWEDFGIPDDESKRIIENAIEKYDKHPKTYKTVGDIEQ